MTNGTNQDESVGLEEPSLLQYKDSDTVKTQTLNRHFT